MVKKKFCIILLVFTLLLGCTPNTQATPPPDRESLIPTSQKKITPEDDLYPPRSETDEYEDPIPLPYPINTAGAEDSAFMIPDGQTLYVWFTPSPQIPVEQQVVDGVTGIYVFHKTPEGWSSAERVMLQDQGKLALDGCGFVQNNIIWFCTARVGYSGLHWFTAEFKEGTWQNWQLADFEPSYEVGELHISADGRELYFHSARTGGQGGYDIWVSEKVDGAWQEPTNLDVLNSPQTDGWPFLSQDGMELWFTRGDGAPSLYRSLRVEGEWTTPELIFSNFAGEASLDNAGNVYFTHHFYKDGVMLEADIYMALKK